MTIFCQCFAVIKYLSWRLDRFEFPGCMREVLMTKHVADHVDNYGCDIVIQGYYYTTDKKTILINLFPPLHDVFSLLTSHQYGECSSDFN
jgi:hypothetical protein